jgi:DnaJ-class molecular chaperone
MDRKAFYSKRIGVEICPTCEGNGSKDREVCSTCGGFGLVEIQTSNPINKRIKAIGNVNKQVCPIFMIKEALK